LAVGQVELEGKTLVLKRIHVSYRLHVDAGTDRATVERVHGLHAERCPVFRSIHPQIHCTTVLEVVSGGR
jgi:uncharacterized OsmC-like protein